MDILTKTELRLRFDEMVDRIRQGAVFIHPTDTIYGLGCNALKENSVKKIRDLKERPDSPFSVWVPSIKWIKDNCKVDKKAEEWLKELPGPYTLVIKLKDKKVIAKNVSGNDTIGVRVPDHWFSKIVEEANVPVITTSVNKAGKMFMTDKDNLNPEIEKGVSFMIYEGKKTGRPSKIINLVEGKIKGR